MTALEKVEAPEQPIKDFGVQAKSLSDWMVVTAFLVVGLAVTVAYLSSNNKWMFSGGSNGVDHLGLFCVIAILGVAVALYCKIESLQDDLRRELTVTSLAWYSNVLTPYLSKKYGVRFLEVATHSGPHRVEKDGNVFEVQIFGIDFKLLSNAVSVSEHSGEPKWPFNFPHINGEIELKQIPNRLLYEKLPTTSESSLSTVKESQ